MALLACVLACLCTLPARGLVQSVLAPVLQHQELGLVSGWQAATDQPQHSAAPADGASTPMLSTLISTAVSESTFDVDYVISWYNSHDSLMQERYNERLQLYGTSEIASGALNKKRFTDAGELKYNIRAVLKNAPWIRKVVIIVADDSSLPDWLRESHPRLQIARHSEMFANPSDLPTFNSHAIESRLHHIPGLAEHFIYANDDMFLNRPVSRNAFFTPDGKARVYIGDIWGPKDPGSHGKAVRNAMEAYRSSSFPAGHDLLHQMKAFTRSDMQRAYEKFSKRWDETSSHPFRHNKDVWTLYLTTTNCVDDRHCSLDRNTPTSTFVILPGRGVSVEFGRVLAQNPTLFCVNDSDSATAAQFEEALARHFPEKSALEK